MKLSWRIRLKLASTRPSQTINTLRPRQNERHFTDDTFKRIFLNENIRISIKISLKFVPMGPTNNNPALVQIMAWRRSGDKPLSEPMMVSFLTHLCVTRPQWVKGRLPWNQKPIHRLHVTYQMFLSIFVPGNDGILENCEKCKPDITDSYPDFSCRLTVDSSSDTLFSLQWRHNDHDSVSNHQPHGCLFNRLFRRRSK